MVLCDEKLTRVLVVIQGLLIICLVYHQKMEAYCQVLVILHTNVNIKCK